MYYQDNGQRSYKPLIKYADRINDTALQFTKILADIPLEYAGVEKQITERSNFITFNIMQNS